MSKKDHSLKNQLKNAEQGGRPKGSDSGGGAHPESPNDLAGTPQNPREQGQGHQRQPKP